MNLECSRAYDHCSVENKADLFWSYLWEVGRGGPRLGTRRHRRKFARLGIGDWSSSTRMRHERMQSGMLSAEFKSLNKMSWWWNERKQHKAPNRNDTTRPSHAWPSSLNFLLLLLEPDSLQNENSICIYHTNTMIVDTQTN